MNTVAVFSAPILGLAIIGATNKSRLPSSNSRTSRMPIPSPRPCAGAFCCAGVIAKQHQLI